MGRGYRTKLPSSRLKDFVTNTIRTMSPSDCSPSSLPSSGSPYPIAHYVNCNNFSLAHRVFLDAIEQEKEPMTYNEAVKDHRWCKAMQSEVDALENNQTWTITSLPAEKKALGCKWVYKIKRKSDGTVERLKVRSVILGNYQVEGIDYTVCSCCKDGDSAGSACSCCCERLGAASYGCSQCLLTRGLARRSIYEAISWF